jgi:GT2 family glycosyltransferase
MAERAPSRNRHQHVMSNCRPVADGLSVVIPTIGEPLLRGCLDSIASGTTWPAQTIVVDQSGRPDVDTWIGDMRRRGLDTVHIAMAATGVSAATNRGLECVRTPYVAVTHDDCRVDSEWVERLAFRLPRLGQAVLTGRVEPDGPGIVLTIKTALEPATYTTPLLNGDVLFPPNMAFPVGVVHRVGWFDEHPSLATAGEDNDWAHRILRAGMPIVYDPTVVVYHLARHRPEDLASLYRRYARGQGAFYGKWLRRGDLLIARRAARDLVRAPWLLFRGLLTRNPDLIAMGQGEVTGLSPGIAAGLRNRPERRRA